MKIQTIPFILLLALSACKSDTEQTTKPNSNSVLSFTDEKVFTHTGNCDDEKQPCALVDMKFLQMTDSSQQCYADLNQTLKLSAMQCAMLLLDSVKGQPEINKIAAEYIKSYEDYIKEFPDVAMSWEARSTMKLLFQNDSLLSFLTTGFNFSGGAHPNSANEIIVYDKARCKKLSTNELFTENDNLLKTVEKHFRAKREVPANQSLNDFGFFFENDKFILPANIGFEKDSVLFIYNDYEVGPHVIGGTEFKIPKSELLPFLKTKY